MEKIENYSDIVKLIRLAMAKKGVTQKELAEVVGCHQPQIARMLKGDVSPTIAYVLKVCDYLKIRLAAAIQD